VLFTELLTADLDMAHCRICVYVYANKCESMCYV